jgi:hypothetical protein
MTEHFLTTGTVITLTGTVHVPLRVEPPRHVEHPYQMTLAVPGLVMPFTTPGYFPTSAISLPSGFLVGGQPDQPS